LPILSFDEHKAAVRALAWSPHQYGVLLSGGGNIDKSLKFWNINTGNLTVSVETESQVKTSHNRSATLPFRAIRTFSSRLTAFQETKL